MTTERFNLLMEKYLDGALATGERAEFFSLIKEDESMRSRYVEELTMEAAVRDVSRAAAATVLDRLSPSGVRGQPAVSMPARAWPRMAAAAVFVIVGIGLFALIGNGPRPMPVIPGGAAVGDAGADSGNTASGFDSQLRLAVYSLESGEPVILGYTPSQSGTSISVPRNGNWFVEVLDPEAHGAAAEIKSQAIPGVRLQMNNSTQALKELAGCKTLRYLWLSNITNEGLRYVGDLPGLQTLYVGAYDSTTTPPESIQALARLKSLTSLTLTGAFPPELLDSACAIQSLTMLDARGWPLNSDALVRLRALKNLKTLRVYGTGLAESTLLADAPKLAALTELGAGEYNFSLQCLQELRRKMPQTQVNGWDAFETAKPFDREKVVADLNQGIDAAITESPDHYLPPTAQMLRKLKRPVSMQFVDRSLADCAADIERFCGVPVLIDPRISTNGSINLRVSAMASDLTLDWIARLASLEVVYRGDCALLTTGETAIKLRTRRRIFALHASAGESPWTNTEAAALRSLLQTFPLRFETSPDDGMYRRLDLLQVQSSAENLTADIQDEHIAEVEGIIKWFDHPPALSTSMNPARIQAEANLDCKIRLNDSALMDAIAAITKATGVNIFVDPKLAAQDGLIDRITFDGTAREALLALAAQAKLCVTDRGTHFFISSHVDDMNFTPYIVDLRPALAAGVQKQELLITLNTIASEARSEILPVEVRGRYFVMMDAWTRVRLATVIDAAVKTGKVPAAPPAPWFHATFSNAGQRVLVPPALPPEPGFKMIDPVKPPAPKKKANEPEDE
jgi:hypothetical protein